MRKLDRAKLIEKFADSLYELIEINLQYNGLRYSPETNVHANQIQEIDENTFQNLAKLEKIILYDHLIKKIHQDSFRGLTSIKNLGFAYNQISEIHRTTFKDLKKLTHILFYSNQIEEIPVGLFKGLESLTHIDFSSNRINQIDKDLFKDLSEFNLTHIFLSNNQLKQIHRLTFTNLNKLTHIDLSGNQINSISKDLFKGLDNLSKIYLNNNNLKSVPDYTFQSLKSLSEIRLNNNQIEKLDKNSFSGLDSLQSIWLHNNKLSDQIEFRLIISETVKFVSFKTSLNSEDPANDLDLVTRKELSYSDFKKLKKIGQGNFGVVYSVEDKLNRIFAMKISLSLEPSEAIVTEHKLLPTLDSPFIIKYVNSFLEGENFYLIMEFCESDLSKQIKAHKKDNIKFNNNTIIQWMQQITNGVNYLHFSQIIHRDLKPSNILLDREGKIKLCDFGVSRPVNLSSGLDFSTLCIGTFIYMSPEMRNETEGITHYSFNTDCWSAGCILYELISLEIFWKSETKNDQDVIARISNLETSYFQDYLQNALKWSKSDRASSEKLKEIIDLFQINEQ